MTRDPLKVALLAYDGLCTFEFGVMVEIFGLPRPEFKRWYRLYVAGLESGPMRASGGILVEAQYTLRVLDTAGTIIIPGWRGLDAPVPAGLIRKLQRAHDQNARILSVCSGAFVLAEAGLLDGKCATTHWKYADALASRYPKVSVDPDVLFVDEGNVITSAGSAAGVDLGLHLVRRDFGAAAANTVARRLVVPPQRDGGQKQFVGAPLGVDPDEQAFARVLDDIRSRLRQPHTIESMAKRARMSPRTFARRFKDTAGTTPHRWLQHERVRIVQSLLETTGLPLDRIAERAGFSDAQLMRMHFKRVVGTTPTAYQRTFR